MKQEEQEEGKDAVDPTSLLCAEAAKFMDEKLCLAAEKYEEALRIKDDFYEALIALGQQSFERAKLFSVNAGAAAHAEELWAAKNDKKTSAEIVDLLFEQSAKYYKDSLELLPVVAQRHKEAASAAADRAAASGNEQCTLV